MLFTGANDDIYALFITMVQQYYLPVRLAGALLLAYVLWRGLRALLRCRWLEDCMDGVRLPAPMRWLGRLAFLYLTYIVVLLGIFGGSLGWQTAVNWENAGVTKDEFLNEAILDNVRTICRAYNLNERMLACNGLDFTTEDIRNLAARAPGKPADTDDLDVYLTKEAQGPPGQAQTGHRYLSESFAFGRCSTYSTGYPHLAARAASLVARTTRTPDVPCRMARAQSPAVTGVVTDFADANLYPSDDAGVFAAPCRRPAADGKLRLRRTSGMQGRPPGSASAPSQAQGFDHFYSRGDLAMCRAASGAGGWGAL